jgi:hypothetical protein
MAALTTQAIIRAGLTPSFASAAGGGDTFNPDLDTYLRVKNASGSSITVTVVTPRTDPVGNAVADTTFTVPATTGDVIAGPFPAEIYADPVTGVANITYSGVTSLTIAVLKPTRP